MIRMADLRDQEQLHLCILKLLEKGSNGDFKKLQELCEEISKDVPDLKIPNNHSTSTSREYTIDDKAKQQLTSVAREDLASFIPVETEDDGSCLFRALSFLCFGDQNRHRELRVRCIIEMALNRHRYLGDEDLFERSKAEGNYIKKSKAGTSGKPENSDTLNASESETSASDIGNGSTGESEKSTKINGTSPAITANGTAEITNDDRKPAPDQSPEDSGNSFGVNQFETTDVLNTCNPNEFAKFCHIQALEVILKRKIEIICSSIEKDELIELEERFNLTPDPKDLGGDLEPDKPPLTIMWLLDEQHFVPLIPSEAKEEWDSGLGDSLDISDTADTTRSSPSTLKKTKDDSDHDSDDERYMSLEGFEPTLSSTPKKASKDKASDDGNVNNEANERSEEGFKPPLSSTPKKASKDKASDDGNVNNEPNERSEEGFEPPLSSTPKKASKDKASDNTNMNNEPNERSEGFKPPLSSTQKKASKDKASDNANVNNEPNERSEEGFKPPLSSTPKKASKDKASDNANVNNEPNERSEEGFEPPLSSTPKKASKDKASDNANVNNEPNERSEEGFKPPLSSTPKKASKDKASDNANVKSEQDEDSDDEIVDITSGDVMTKLKKLFEYDIKKKALRKKHLSNETLQTLTGPYDVADREILGILKECPIKFVTKLFEVQFQIKWKTDDGKPERFNFYDFCDVEKQSPSGKGKTMHLKYDPRRAHVFTELYRETLAIDMKRKVKREEVFYLDKPKEEFCPDVYVRVKDGWVRIGFASEKCEEVNDFEETFSWMHESLRKFVAEDAEEVTLPSKTEVSYSSVMAAIDEKPTLYWAVLEDTDFRSGDHLKLHEIGKTQVYVGKAEKGIMRRWIKDGSNHSNKMKLCAESICEMKKSFEVSRLRGILLVDARLLLAKIRKENNAVFLIQTFEENDDLKKGEKKHIEGKRIVNGKEDVNIVPYKDIKGTWTPKEMEFGMNMRS